MPHNMNGLFNGDRFFLKELDKFNWTDPYPQPVIEYIPEHKVYVVRDDLLGVGSKVRFIDCLVKNFGNEWVYGGATKVGWGPISLAHVCSKYGKKATVFAAQRKILTSQQKKAIKEGAHFEWVEKMGRLNVCLSRANKYVKEDPVNRTILPMGLEHPLVFGSIIRVARNLIQDIKLVGISEIWTVGGSGTLSRGLQMAFPDTSVNIVQVGHNLNDREMGRAYWYKSDLKYDQKVKKEDLPPYPSEPYYDAKLWKIYKQYGKPDALIWNVA